MLLYYFHLHLVNVSFDYFKNTILEILFITQFHLYYNLGISVLSSFWLSYWSAHRNEHSAWYYLGIYIAISGGILITVTARFETYFSLFYIIKTIIKKTNK